MNLSFTFINLLILRMKSVLSTKYLFFITDITTPMKNNNWLTLLD